MKFEALQSDDLPLPAVDEVLSRMQITRHAKQRFRERTRSPENLSEKFLWDNLKSAYLTRKSPAWRREPESVDERPDLYFLFSFVWETGVVDEGCLIIQREIREAATSLNDTYRKVMAALEEESRQGKRKKYLRDGAKESGGISQISSSEEDRGAYFVSQTGEKQNSERSQQGSSLPEDIYIARTFISKQSNNPDHYLSLPKVSGKIIGEIARIEHCPLEEAAQKLQGKPSLDKPDWLRESKDLDQKYNRDERRWFFAGNWAIALEREEMGARSPYNYTWGQFYDRVKIKKDRARARYNKRKMQ